MKIEVTKELVADLDAHATAASAGTETPDPERLKTRAVIRVGWFVHPSSNVVAVHVDDGSYRVEHADGSTRPISLTLGQPAKPAEPETFDEEPIEVVEDSQS